MIEINNISKSFGQVNALSDCTLKIEDNAMMIIAGGDGAGKTTLLKSIAGLVTPDKGQVLINGQSPRRQKECFGYMAQQFSWYKNLSVNENIILSATLHDLSKKQAENVGAEILKFVGLYPFKDRLAGKLSGGMKQKLALAAVLVYKPQFLLLDEPSTGVDPVSRQEFWELVQQINEQGTTVIVATPYFDEVSYCREVVLMNKGRILINDTLAALKNKFPDKKFNLEDIFFKLTDEE